MGSRLDHIETVLTAARMSGEESDPLVYAAAADLIVEAMAELLPLLREWEQTDHASVEDSCSIGAPRDATFSHGRSVEAGEAVLAWLRGEAP